MLTLRIALTGALLLCAQAAAPALPAPEALFQQAWAAATALPEPVATREHLFIAGDELQAVPEQALRHYQSLFHQLHGWPEEKDSAFDRARFYLKGDGEDDAVRAFVTQRKFEQAIAWLADPKVATAIGSDVAHTYDFLVNRMLQNGAYQGVAAVIQQAAAQGAFPLLAVNNAITSPHLDRDQRWEDARQGIRFTASTRDYLAMYDATEFLAAVHKTFPEMDAQIEDALQSLLAHVKAAAEDNPHSAAGDWRTGARAMALWQQLDPARAEEARVQYPNTVAADRPQPTLLANSSGKITGIEAGSDPVAALQARAAKDPAGALTAALTISSQQQRFSALAAIADSLATGQPAEAAKAAQQAYTLLDPDMAQSNTGAAMVLGRAYAHLGQAQRADEIADAVLTASDQHAAQVSDALDVSSPDAAAQAEAKLSLPAVIISFVYKEVAAYAPAMALAHARGCACSLLQPLLLARVAEGMTPGGARATR